jgi:murein DD-endopeptidase MepM/ murein hydrolase activator NlpD
MANSNLAYRSSISIGNISKSVSGLRDSISGTQGTVVRMGTALRDSNSYKLSSISKSDTLFRSRREAVRRREQEDIVEASSVGGAVKRTGRIISSSTKGFLGRIFDFVGTLMVGWLINNLPTIINLSKTLVERIQKYVSIGSDAVSGLSEMMSGFGGVLGGIYSNIISFDFTDSEGKVSDSMDKLFNGFRRLELSMFNFINLFTQDFNKVFEFETDVDDLDIPDLPALGDSGAPGGGEFALPDAVKQDKEFTQAVKQLASRLNVREDYLYAVMGFETGGTFSPSIENPASGATGLIQFMPETAKGLGTTTGQLAQMSRTEQLKYVEKYLSNKGIQGGSLSDVYMAVLFPAAVGKPDNFVLFGKGAMSGFTGIAYEQNKGLDLNKDGSITKAEAASKVKQYLPKTTTAAIAPAQQLGRLRGGEDLSGKIGTGVKNIEITDAYGARGGDHKGIDIAAPAGTYIALRVDCRVVATQTGGRYGNVIDVWVPQYNVQLRFAHCQSFIITSGEIKAGTSFARVGRTGKSSGPHIHFEYSTKYNDTTYGGSGDPSAYVGLILLTNGKSQASATVAQTNKPPAAQINIESSSRDVAALKKEKSANVITVPAPQQPQVATVPIMMDKESSFIPSGDNVNTFITKKFLLDLAYT